MTVFQAAQQERERRAKRFIKKSIKRTAYPFSGFLRCDKCGKNYKRKITATGPVWICTTFSSQGKVVCASKQIPENKLLQITSEVLGVKSITADLLRELLTGISICDEEPKADH